MGRPPAHLAGMTYSDAAQDEGGDDTARHPAQVQRVVRRNYRRRCKDAAAWRDCPFVPRVLQKRTRKREVALTVNEIVDSLPERERRQLDSHKDSSYQRTDEAIFFHQLSHMQGMKKVGKWVHPQLLSQF